ncbi:MAG: hypothetical protein J6B10_06145 [Lachnospiraceae bacterium]|nr:hypothetical protein [Lachnospiraceae bacterium]
MDQETKAMFGMILDELGRMEERVDKRFSELEERMDKRFDKIEKKLETMQHEINACKMEKKIA